MKKLLLLSILGAIEATYFAQSYTPFPTSNASWIDQEACTENHYRTIGDTVVNGLVYHMIYVNEKTYTQTAQTGCTNSSTFTISSYYAGAYRNDSVQKKVFFLPPLQSRDTILYDFNLSVGDTLRPSYKMNLDQSRQAVTVLRTDSILYGNIYHKRYTFNFCPSNFLDTLRFIEGIGSNQTFLRSYDICNFDYLLLECFKINGQTIYSDPGGTCQLITGIHDLKSDELLNIRLSPNPTQGIVNIPYIEGLVQVEVFDLGGKLLQNFVDFDSAQSDKSIERVNKINLSNYKNGIYILKLNMKNGEVFSKKIIRK